MKILIVDDDQVTRKRIISTLKKTNFQPIECNNGQEALDVLQEPDPPSLVVMDWIMPEMNGLDLCKKIRSGSNLLSTYIIMLSSKSDGQDVQEGFKAGVNDYVRKPFSTIELMARINVGAQVLNLQDTVKKQNSQLFHNCKLATIGEMAANIAHEINNPITVINGFAQQANRILEGQELNPEKLRRCHDKILVTSQRITKVIKNLLTLSRNSSDKFEKFKVSKIIESSVELCEQKLKHHNVRLIVKPYDEELMIEGKENNFLKFLST